MLLAELGLYDDDDDDDNNNNDSTKFQWIYVLMVNIRAHDVNRRTHSKLEQFKCVGTFQTEILCCDKLYFRVVTSASPVLSEYGARCRSNRVPLPGEHTTECQ